MPFLIPTSAAIRLARSSIHGSAFDSLAIRREFIGTRVINPGFAGRLADSGTKKYPFDYRGERSC